MRNMIVKPKLDDVAKLAGVSRTTVSRVLNNRGYLSQKTIDKVHTAMTELNYQPNIVARQLFKKQTNIIGLLFPTIANPFFGELVAALETRLYTQGFKVIVGNSMNDPAKEAEYLNQLMINQVDGLIVGTHNQGIEQYETKGLPIVAFDRIMNRDIPVVESDNYQGGQLATQRLIDHGAKHIIHTNGPITLETPAKRRRKAYESTMLTNNLVPQTCVVDFNIPYADKKKIFQQIFIDHPEVDAIFASNDVDAAQIMQVAAEAGRKIPNDLLLIGYDGTQLMRNVLPQLTTIIQPIDQIATTAIDLLKQRLAGKPTQNENVIPVKLWLGTTDHH